MHQLSASGEGREAGGLIMRGLGAVPRWPLNPEIVVAGTGSDKLSAAAIYADGRFDAPLIRLDVSGHKARFPAGAAMPPANERYVLRLMITDRLQPVDIAFIGAAAAGPSLLVVLRAP